jgi:hypothetical protein
MNKPSIPVLIAIALIAAIGILLIAAIAAGATPACMSKAEARAKFPRAHLYWHTLDRCWDNQPGRRRPSAKRPSREPDGKIAPPTLAGVSWQPRPFDGADALSPPVVLGVVAYRWPESNVIDVPVLLIEPITIADAAEFNEIDQQADIAR